MDFILKNKSIFTFSDTGLDTQRFDQKMNSNYLTRFKFCLSLDPLLILTPTPFKHGLWQTIIGIKCIIFLKPKPKNTFTQVKKQKRPENLNAIFSMLVRRSPRFKKHWWVHTAQCAHWTVCTLNSVHSANCTVHSAHVQTAHCAVCTLQTAQYTVHSANCTLHSAQAQNVFMYTKQFL